MNMDEMRAMAEDLAPLVMKSRASDRNKELTIRAMRGEQCSALAAEYAVCHKRIYQVIHKTCRVARYQEARRMMLEARPAPKPKPPTKMEAMKARHGWPVRPKVTWVRETGI
jgi:hypothetical protein